MHIADGILSAPVIAAGFGGTAVIAAVTMRKMDLEEIPKISVMSAVFFVANLIHIPVGPTSIHFILNGLVGVILGPRAFAAIIPHFSSFKPAIKGSTALASFASPRAFMACNRVTVLS